MRSSRFVYKHNGVFEFDPAEADIVEHKRGASCADLDQTTSVLNGVVVRGEDALVSV